MANIKLGSAGVTATEIDMTGPVATQPQGVPAGIIGTANGGPAFVPITVGNVGDFYKKFGTTDGKKFGLLAATEWLRNAQALTYVRVLGVGQGLQREADGTVLGAGFVVGEQQPTTDQDSPLGANPFAYLGGPEGRTYFLGALMSASFGATNSDPNGLFVNGIQPNATAIPFVRGVIMAPSGVVLTLSSSVAMSNIASPNVTSLSGSSIGSVKTQDNNASALSQFVMLLNGHVDTAEYPAVLTASFDPKSGGNYFSSKLNTNPLKMQEAGHYLYAAWDMPGFVVTGSNVVNGSTVSSQYTELSAFILTGSANYNSGSTTTPNFENFEDRFRNAKTPWIISQKLGGKYTNLFRLHSLSDGKGVSEKYKFSIENLTPSSDKANPYGAFDLLIRDWNDLDTNQKVYEKYTGLTLDPSSDRYIVKVIGDYKVYYDFDRDEPSQKLVVEGNYTNMSSFVRVEVSSELDQGIVDPTALPFGFRGVYHLNTSGSAPLSSVPDYGFSLSTVMKNVKEVPLPFNVSVFKGSTNKFQNDPASYWGVAFQEPVLLSGLKTQLGKKLNVGVKSFAKYFPDFKTDTLNFVVGDNTGVADTVANGIADADRFNYNLFTLENVAVYTSSLTQQADPQRWADAQYLRSGVGNGYPRSLSVTDLTTENRRYAKFSFIMQGGWDGVNLFDEQEANITNQAVESDMQATNRGSNFGPNVRAYIKALDVMKNVVNADIQLLAMPGIRNQYVTNTAITDVEQRFDAMYLMDVQNIDMNNSEVTSSIQNVSVQNTVSNFLARNLNSSFAAAYFPDVLMVDPTLGTSVAVPPTVVVLGALALNDAVGHPWFAPAGFARGSLTTTLEPKVKLSKLNQDVLYDADINPLVQFTTNPIAGTNPTGNVVVWGQKTLLTAASALDRVNVRRLLIEIRRQVRDIAQTILFEPNRAATLARFSAAVTPRLQRIQALAGLERFKVVIDSSTTTQADVENNTVRGKIFVQPTRTVEFVSLDFVVANNIQQ